MSQKCSECKWFDYFVNPATGRKKPSEKGVCGFPLPWPTVWPAYIGHPPYLQQNRTWSDSGYNCKAYAPSSREGGSQSSLFAMHPDAAINPCPICGDHIGSDGICWLCDG